MTLTELQWTALRAWVRAEARAEIAARDVQKVSIAKSETLLAIAEQEARRAFGLGEGGDE